MMEQPNTFDDPALLIVDIQNDFVRQDAPLQVPDAPTKARGAKTQGYLLGYASLSNGFHPSSSNPDGSW